MLAPVPGKKQITPSDLRAFSVARSMFAPTKLETAIERMGFVQADPIRAPARAQDLILRHRVKAYRAGDLETKYAKLKNIEEDYFVNYGFLPRRLQPLMHPREYEGLLRIERDAPHLLERVLAFVREHGPTHPKALEREFGKLNVGNYWGGTSQATTRVLEGLHYRGQLRVARREGGIKVYAVAEHLSELQPLTRAEQARGLANLILNVYAPLPVRSLLQLVSLSGYGAPHLVTETRNTVKHMVKHELETLEVNGLTFVWPATEKVQTDVSDQVRLLAPFDPVAWDRLRFEALHGWEYRFEAYTPPAKRKLGYYALPLLWRDAIIGWANAKVVKDVLEVELGFVGKRPRERAFTQALQTELEAMRAFLNASDVRVTT